MNENLKNLLEKIDADEDLRARFDSICQMDDNSAAVEAMLVLAAEADMPLEAADLEVQEELDFDELNAVAGGGYTPTCPSWKGVMQAQYKMDEMRRAADAAYAPKGRVLVDGVWLEKEAVVKYEQYKKLRGYA